MILEIPTQEHVADILATPDLALRNLRITLCYSDFAHALARRFGRRNLLWPAVATYASKTAGESIRNEILPELLDIALTASPTYRQALDRLHERLRQGGAPPPETGEPLSDALIVVSDHISEGNRTVFAELGPLYAALLEHFTGSEAENRLALEAILERFRRGSVEEGGQSYVRKACRDYLEALHEEDAKRRAELVLRGNLRIAYGEQYRLQSYITGALEAPVGELVEDSLRPRRQEPSLLFEDVLSKARNELERVKRRALAVVREVATAALMHLRLPDGSRLDLSQDIPTLASGKPFPDELEQLEDPTLRSLVELLDPCPEDLAGSGARDWGDFGERMHYLTDLFRQSQQDARFLRRPFSLAQERAIRQGEMPEGRL